MGRTEDAARDGGFGGQGLLFAGHVLAQAALLEGRTVSWMPSYGPEMRGWTASCTVMIADHPIGSPIVDSADRIASGSSRRQDPAASSCPASYRGLNGNTGSRLAGSR
jgi:hypothetical protein